jgi:hypothetical protein
LNTNNFHKYIDHHPNVLAIVKLTNGRKIAAFSVDPIRSKTLATHGGLLLSLT